MAKQVKTSDKPTGTPHQVTSIGRSVNTKPKNKHARKGFKKYRGQG